MHNAISFSTAVRGALTRTPEREGYRRVAARLQVNREAIQTEPALTLAHSFTSLRVVGVGSAPGMDDPRGGSPTR
jgi:hypothetical protein